ncbi:5'-nucleotidase [Candidatus Nitrospira inopinata]|uniref:5'-nucleotidase n=1 Tax=Candidatus Nitrospira inopinata TaxID=1715989 RepID=A0A0S4KY94_9BACT|nr:5'-nucleotidase [Candidatus Nitrospira inopinata]
MCLDGVRCSFIARFIAMSLLCFDVACVTSPVFAAGSVERYSPDWDRDDGRDDTIESRKEAERKLEWKSPEFHRRKNESLLHVQVLGINDFHGQLSEGRRVANRPVGGAAVLAAYLEAAQQDPRDPDLSERTFIVHAGDHVGATPPESALLQDEPSIGFLNLLANRHCRHDDRRERKERRLGWDELGWDEHDAQDERRDRRLHPKCNLVGTPGNHEFDEGKDELLRLLNGGNHPSGPFLETPYRGARFPTVSANVVDEKTGKPIFPPYVIKQVKNVRLAFIGAVLKETPTIVTPTGVAGLKFLDEADSINRYVRWLRKTHGLRTFIVLLHQGGRQTTYEGPTQSNGLVNGRELVDIVSRLDDDVDVVISGHAHAFTNALLKNRNGAEILVTQAFSAGTAYGDIDLLIDRQSRDVVAKSASIVTTYRDAGPGLTPHPQVARLVERAQATVAPLVNRVIGTAATDLVRAESPSGESALGNLIADAQRAALGTDFAFMNPGGIRADLAAGPVTYGQLFTIQPFGNSLVRMELTGQQIYDLLNQQWVNQPFPRILKTSGLTYVWDGNRPIGDRIVEVSRDGVPIDRLATYTVTINSFLAAGGDNFTVLLGGRNQIGGPLDLDALIAFIQTLSQPFSASIEGRIVRLN